MKIQISLSTHFEDLYSGGFLEFRKKYLPLHKRHQALGLWVNFSNFKNDNIDKTPHNDPDHTDPIGIYCYPIEYVLKYPADIWYGQRCKYVRVLKNKVHPHDILYTQSLHTLWAAESFLNNIGYTPNQIDMYLKKAKQYVKKHHSTGEKYTLGKAAFFMFQRNMELPDYPLRSGQEQTKILLRAGIHAIIDEASRPSKAIINDREPHQMVFLTREFEIVDVFENNRVSEGTITTKTDDTDLALRLATRIALEIGDFIPKKRPRTSNENGWNIMWSKKGRRLSIYFKQPASYFNKKFGEKGHKEYKITDDQYPHIIMWSEKGKLERVYDSSDKFKEIARSFAKEFLSSTDVDDAWEPETEKLYLQKKDEEQNRIMEQRRAREANFARKDIDGLRESIDWLADRFGINMNFLYSAEDRVLHLVCSMVGHGIREFREEGNIKWEEDGSWFGRILRDEDKKYIKPIKEMLLSIYRECKSERVLDFRGTTSFFGGKDDELAWPLYLFKYAKEELAGEQI